VHLIRFKLTVKNLRLFINELKVDLDHYQCTSNFNSLYINFKFILMYFNKVWTVKDMIFINVSLSHLYSV